MRNLIYILCGVLAVVNTYAQTGNPDPAFGTNGITITPVNSGRDEITAMAVQSDGKVVVAGHSDNGSNADFLVARYNANGTLDNTFGGGDGIVTTSLSRGDDIAFDIAVQNDGYIVVAGFAGTNNNDFAVVRYEPDGDLDATFGGTGKVTRNIATSSGDPSIDIAQALTLQSDGKIVLAGYYESGTVTDFAVVRLETNGTMDATFGGGDGIVTNHISFDDYATDVIVMPDSKILVCGFSGSASFSAFTLLRYNTDGTLDNSFGGGDGIVISSFNGSPAHDEAHSMAVQSDGKIILAGQIMRKIEACCGFYDFGVVRYNSDGSFDNTFGTNGLVKINIEGEYTSDDIAKSVDLQADGKIMVAGNNDRGDFTLLRLEANGAPDISFGSGDGIVHTDLGNGNNDFVNAMKLVGNRIYVAGATGVLPDLSIAMLAIQNDAGAAASLPVTLQQFAAQKQNSAVQLQWLTDGSEDNIVQFEIERSGDGRSFLPIGITQPIKTNSLKKNYTFIDKQPLTGINFYRLRVKETNGKIKLSYIVAIKANKLTAQLEIFPNPVPKTLRMQLPDGLNGKIDMVITDASGRVVKTLTFAGSGSSMALSIDVSTLKKGVYLIKAQTSGTSVTGKFLKD